MSESLIDFRSLVDSYDFAPDGQEKFNTLFGLLDKAIGSSTSGTDANEAVANSIDEISNRDEPEGFLWTLWTLLIEISKRIPLDDPRAQSLVEITQKLKVKQSATVEVWGSTYSLWTDMPLFGAVMREAWNGEFKTASLFFFSFSPTRRKEERLFKSEIIIIIIIIILSHPYFRQLSGRCHYDRPVEVAQLIRRPPPRLFSAVLDELCSVGTSPGAGRAAVFSTGQGHIPNHHIGVDHSRRQGAVR